MVQTERIEGVFIHDEAIVETSQVGEGTRIWAFAHILKDAKIGKNCNICDHTFIEGDVVIGDNEVIHFKGSIVIYLGGYIEDRYEYAMAYVILYCVSMDYYVSKIDKSIVVNVVADITTCEIKSAV